MPDGGSCVVFAGGGTGGHLMPGIAVAEEIRALDPAGTVLFLTRADPLEEGILREKGFDVATVPASRLGPGPIGAARGFLDLGRSAVRSLSILKRRSVGVVVGLGGYVSAGPLLAARMSGVPFFLMEQNAILGKVNRHFAPRSSGTFVPWKSSAPAGLPHVVPLGNPVRRAIRGLLADGGKGNPPTLLVLGGSQGSRAVNEIMMRMLPVLEERGTRWRFLHVAGASQADAVRAAYARHRVEADVRPFVAEIDRWYARSDLAIARAGGTTLAELCVAGIPSILVPLPTAADDHQRANAKVLEKARASVIIEEGPGAAERCLAALDAMLEDPGRMTAMSQAARGLAKPHAAVQIASKVLEKAAGGRA